jgi:hypothetical protein
MSVDEEELAAIQTKVLQSMRNKQEYSQQNTDRNPPRTSQDGGSDLLDLQTEVGISQLKYFRDSVFTNSEAGKFIVMNVTYMQLKLEMLPPALLENLVIRISFLTPTWMTSLRHFLFNTIYNSP